MTKTETGRLAALRIRLAGKPLFGFDTRSWADQQETDATGQATFATVGDKEQREPPRGRAAKVG